MTIFGANQIREIERLHSALSPFVADGALVGPDPVGRLNFRVWRFLFNYVSPLWKEDWRFLQAQGYWTLANLILFRATGRDAYWTTATQSAEWIVSNQRADGAWDYPRVSHERLDLIATVEGCWAGLALLEMYSVTGDSKWLVSARKWDSFVESQMRYTPGEADGVSFEAVNYYWPVKPRGRVTNNSTMMVNFSRLAAALSGDQGLAKHCDGMMKFIKAAQLPSGEFWYYLGQRQHYLCFQYNAYQFLDLAHVYNREPSEELRQLLLRNVDFLRRGQATNGECLASCNRALPHISYHTAALAHAFYEGARLGLGEDLHDRSRLAVECLLSQVRSDAGWVHSIGDYGGLLSDRRRYPRYMAMTLYHLCCITWPDHQPFRAGRLHAPPSLNIAK